MRRLLAFGAMLLVGSPALADIQYQNLNGGANVSMVQHGDGSWSVTIFKTSTNEAFQPIIRLYSDDASDNDEIRSLHMEYNTSPGLNGDRQEIVVNISGLSSVRTPIAVIEEISVELGRPAIMDISIIDITGDLGAPGSASDINPSNVRSIQIGGDWYANAVIGEFQNDDDPLTFVHVEGDMVKGSLVYKNPNLVTTIWVEGSILSSVEIWAETVIDGIYVYGDCFGKIGTNSEGIAGNPDVRLIDIDGDFAGASVMAMNSLETLDVGGDFDVDLTLNNAMLTSSVYKIGGEFASSAVLSLPADGLLGQISINTQDGGDLWLGDVEVGSTTLAHNYTALSSELGDGATGESPYNFHQRITVPPAGETRDCDPYQTELVALGAADELREATISHYGPVYAEGTGPHFRVEFRPFAINPNGGSIWIDRTALFEVDTAQSGTTDATAQRDVVIKAIASNSHGFKVPGTWRIRPINEGATPKVRSGTSVGNPCVVYDSSVWM